MLRPDRQSVPSENAPFLPLATVQPRVVVSERPDGALLLRDPRPLAPREKSVVAYLRRWADTEPARIMLAEREPEGGWRTRSYGEVSAEVASVAQGLLDHGLVAGDSILILSGNTMEHAVLCLAAMTVGVVVVPVSPAYALAPTGDAKLKRIIEIVRPTMIFAQSWTAVAPAIRRLGKDSLPVISVSGFGDSDAVIVFAQLVATKPTERVDAAYARTGPDTIAKILFSSGSTGWPKGIINTQQMLCTNMSMMDTMWAAEEQTKAYVTLSWMPWSHTMAGNGLFHRSLRQGGAYYIDDGRPLPGEFHKTLRNLREISPHSHSDVPAGYAMLTEALEQDDDLACRFFVSLAFAQYAGASLPVELWQRFQDVAVRTVGRRIPFLTGYGCTEAGPLITQLYWPVEGSGFIGLPVPGIEVKLIPVDATRYEVRARGPNITPGYLRDDEAYAAMLDEDGFYCTGDAVTFVDRSNPELGLRFASRVAEDFKLLTGTFVTVGHLRAALVGALMPLVSDMVLTGHDRPYVGALVWPNLTACRQLLGDPDMPVENIIRSPQVTSAIRDAARRHNDAHSGSSMRLERLLLLEEAPSAECNEITDKGYVNQRAVLDRRAELVDCLYASTPGPEIIIISDKGR